MMPACLLFHSHASIPTLPLLAGLPALPPTASTLAVAAHALLLPLVLTIFVEGLVMLLFARRWQPVYYTLLCNLLTNPLLNLALLLAYHAGGRGLYWALVPLLECAVVLGEGLLLARLNGWRYRKSILASLLLNGLSFGLGLLLL